MSTLACENCGATHNVARCDELEVTLCGPCFGARADARTDGVYAMPMARVKRERVEWLWPDRLPLAGISLIVGDPGLGKSTLTNDVAARTSRGEFGEPASVLMITAEDSISAVVRPRLEAAGADLNLVRAVSARRDGFEQGIELPDDVPELDRLVGETEAQLVVIDPLMAHLPDRVNSWRDQSVRTALAPLHRLAEEHHCAVVIVAHLNKAMGVDPLYRTGGSVGIPAAARSALVLMRDPDDPDGEEGSSRVLAHFKSNYGPLAPSLRYQLESVHLDGDVLTARLVADGESDHAARDLLSVPTGEERTERDEAVDFLRAELAGGPRPAKELQRASKAMGVSERTLRRAKKTLGITSEKAGIDGGWRWSLPNLEGGQGEGGHPYIPQVATFASHAGNGAKPPPSEPEGGHPSEMAPLATIEEEAKAARLLGLEPFDEAAV